LRWDAPPEPAGPAPGFEFAPHGPRLVAFIDKRKRGWHDLIAGTVVVSA
jgi:uncharacterized RDD family membrane protein YckC